MITGQINLANMVAKHIGAIVLLNAKLVILTTVVTKRPLVFHLTQLAHLITLIVLLNVPLGVVILDIPKQGLFVLKINVFILEYLMRQKAVLKNIMRLLAVMKIGVFMKQIVH